MECGLGGGRGGGVQGVFQFPFKQHSVSFLAYVYMAVNVTHCRNVWAPNLWVELILFIVQSEKKTNSKHTQKKVCNTSSCVLIRVFGKLFLIF